MSADVEEAFLRMCEALGLQAGPLSYMDAVAALEARIKLGIKRPRVGVGVVIQYGDGFVLLRRRGAHGAGEWSFPGGSLEFGERLIDCAIRETQEEIDVALHDPVLLPIITEDLFPDDQLHFITHYIRGHALMEPRLMEPNKADAIMIVPPEQFPEPLFVGVAELRDKGFLGDIKPDGTLPRQVYSVARLAMTYARLRDIQARGGTLTPAALARSMDALLDHCRRARLELEQD